MIITKEKVKAITGINGSTYDSQIDAIIPGATSAALAYTKNPFHIPGQFVKEYSISFVASSKKIINSAGNFITESYGNVIRFQPGLFCHVKNSILNDGFYKIAAASAGELTLSNDDVIFDESDGTLITIYLVKIDEGFILNLAKYIYHLLFMKNPGLQSESIGDYSYSKSSESEMLDSLFKGYKKIGVV